MYLWAGSLPLHKIVELGQAHLVWLHMNQPGWLCCVCVAHLHWSHTRLLQTGSEAPTLVSAVSHNLVSGQIRPTWQRMWLATLQVFNAIITGGLRKRRHLQGDHRSQAATAFCRPNKASPSVPSQSAVGLCCSLRSAFKETFSTACLLPSAGQTLVKCRSNPVESCNNVSVARQMSAGAKTA